jgi:hypothetical protein
LEQKKSKFVGSVSGQLIPFYGERKLAVFFGSTTERFRVGS